jgi:hypothetical protein
MNMTVQIGAGQIAVLFFLLAVVGTMLFVQQNRIEKMLKSLIKGESTVATTLQQLDAAIAAEGVEETTLAGAVTALATLITQLGVDIAALIAAVQAGQDFTSELNAVNANLATATATATSVANVTTAAQAEDTSVTGETGSLGGSPTAKPAP